jgi:hypothetical protein
MESSFKTLIKLQLKKAIFDKQLLLNLARFATKIETV